MALLDFAMALHDTDLSKATGARGKLMYRAPETLGERLGSPKHICMYRCVYIYLCVYMYLYMYLYLYMCMYMVYVYV